ncbi:MAG: hypothetical protein JST19_14700 [Bacteroidetes bacterium]|nr:hypothetical protein [Bacteroidota bacterium]
MEKDFIELNIDSKMYIINVKNIASITQLNPYETEISFFTKDKNGQLSCTIPMNYGAIRQLWFIDRLLTDVAINATDNK